jgi:hypothetical protein
MLTMLTFVLHSLRNQRGVVSMEWLILGAVVMAAIVAAFAPAFNAALTSGVTAVSGILTTQIGAGGS